MKQALLWLLGLTAFNMVVYSQYNFRALVKDRETNEPLAGTTALIKGTTLGTIADMNGLVTFENLAAGTYTIEFKFLGYNSISLQYDVLPGRLDTLIVYLTPSTIEMDEVHVSTTRSTRTIEEIPTRVEFIAEEEIEEKSNMRVSDLRIMLSESTGIQMQQTSATSANASIRIQGLDGRYTQILKDGFPVYAGAASGLGLLQTPPLDLRQIEIIKGSASTLYGGGAIAGLVNLITKIPGNDRDLRFLINGSTGKGIDINSYYGERFNKVGTTIFASYNRNEAYDPANIDLTAIPKYDRYVFNPRLFLYLNQKTQLSLGLNTTFEDRMGGDIHYIQGTSDSLHSYYEKNKTQRYSTQLTIEHKFDQYNIVNAKNSVSHFQRKIFIPDYRFDGAQTSTFSEINYIHRGELSEWVTGINLISDHFSENTIDSFPNRSYNQIVAGIFVQNTWKVTTKLNLEIGLRTDYDPDFGVIVLPRISALFKWTSKLSSRIGGGFGYKTPNIFTEESERIHYRNILPITKTTNTLERSYGGNVDVNYRTLLGSQLTFQINQLLFYTYLDHPLILEQQTNGIYRFVNSPGHIDTRGTETNIKMTYQHFNLYLGYTFTNALIHNIGSITEKPLTPKHRINAVFIFEKEEKWKAGMEAYYYSHQKLSDGTLGRQYVIGGIMVEKIWEKISLYINFENIFDVRQTRYGSIYTGSPTKPEFKEIYAPLDGFLINGGIKLKL
ncbi:MAG: TonB-dependent receptor [Bacteroidales bacterium]